MNTNDKSPIDTGGSAFPWQITINSGNWNPIKGRTVPAGQTDVEVMPGMTLRQFYAAHAMQGICARPQSSASHSHEISEKAFLIADAMIAHEKSGK